MTLHEEIAVLIAHKSAIIQARNFEEFRAVQLAFIEFLIEDLMSKIEEAPNANQT